MISHSMYTADFFPTSIALMQAGRELDEEVIRQALLIKDRYQLIEASEREIIETAVKLYGPVYGLSHRIQKFVRRFPLFFPFYFLRTRACLKNHIFILVTLLFVISTSTTLYTFINLLRTVATVSKLFFFINFGLMCVASFGTGFFGAGFFDECYRITQIIAGYRNDFLRTVHCMERDFFPVCEKNKHFLVSRLFDQTVRSYIEDRILRNPTDIVWEFSNLQVRGDTSRLFSS